MVQVKQYKISPEFFEKGYAEGRSPCTCTSKCCAGGVWADPAERDRILLHKDVIKKFMDETQSLNETEWFEHEEIEDGDFPSGKAVGTEIINNKCAFLDQRGWCSTQVAATATGLHKWAWKPLYCVLFPVEVTKGVVGFDDMLQDEADTSCCSIGAEFHQPLFEACKDELTHLLGEDGFEEVREYFAHERGSELSRRESTAEIVQLPR